MDNKDMKDKQYHSKHHDCKCDKHNGEKNCEHKVHNEHGCCHEEHHKDKHDDKYKEKVQELENKVKTLENEILKEKAESINFRKRKEEETARILKFCNEDLIKEILPTIDNFERAIKMDDDDLTDEVSKFLEGTKMIYCNLINTLEKYGVKAIDGANKSFDPTYHQAVMIEKREGIESGMVLEVLQKGYLLKDRVIRPAMVRVSE